MDDELETMAATLEDSGDYRVLRRLMPQARPQTSGADATDAEATAEPTGVGVFLDVETTGLDPRRDEVLQLAMVAFRFNMLDTWRLRGLNTSWRGARIGRIAETLLASPTASPVIVLDEFEKAPALGSHDRPYDVFHSLLEEENAREFTDDFLELPLRADHVLWIAAANGTAGLPGSILDRMLVMAVPDPKGSRPRQPSDQRYENAYLFGAVCPARGVGAALAMPYADTEAMQAHLDEISRTVRRRAQPVLLLDRAGWHTTGDLVVPKNISLVFLPPRSPELNPVENIWQFLRANWLSNRVFETYEAIIDAACEAWTKLTKQPNTITSIAMREWAHKGHS